MTQRNPTCIATGLLALVVPFAQSHAQDCDPVPSRYQQQEYGYVMHSLETSCSRTFSPKEQLFVAGLSQTLLRECGFPSDLQSRVKLQKFLTSSVFVGAIGREYANPNLGEGLGDQAASLIAYTVGEAAAKEIDCTPYGEELAEGVVNYLDRTSAGSGEGPDYVEGCARYYSGRYTKQQCQCIADIGRSVLPSIHQSEFSRESIARIIESNPFVGLQIAMQCQIGDY